MRTFIAVNFTREFRKRLAFFSGVKNESVKWVEPENLHLTLVFMGDLVSDANLGAVKEAMCCFRGFSPFGLSVSGTGAFPGFERPRVLWAGVEQGREELLKMYSILRERLAGAGFLLEDRFSPHITLGRVKKKPEDELVSRFRNYGFSGGPVEKVEKVDLMESVLTQSGPEYKIIYSEKLG